MDALKEWLLYIVRESSHVAENLRGREILIRESLVFVGAVLGGLWGYSVGRTGERNRWRRELRPGLETLQQALKALKPQK
jgi:hypothetical protein